MLRLRKKGGDYRTKNWRGGGGQISLVETMLAEAEGVGGVGATESNRGSRIEGNGGTTNSIVSFVCM